MSSDAIEINANDIDYFTTSQHTCTYKFNNLVNIHEEFHLNRLVKCVHWSAIGRSILAKKLLSKKRVGAFGMS